LTSITIVIWISFLLINISTLFIFFLSCQIGIFISIFSFILYEKKRIDEMGGLLFEVVKEGILEKNKDKMFPSKGDNISDEWEEEKEEEETEEDKKEETDFSELI